MASAAAAIPVQDGKYDPDFTQAILDLNNDYNEVVRRSGGRALPPEELFNLFMIMITVMSGNAEIYSNAYALSDVRTRAAFNSTLAGMAFQFSMMVAMGQSIESSDVAQLLRPRDDLVNALLQQAQLVKTISLEGYGTSRSKRKRRGDDGGSDRVAKEARFDGRVGMTGGYFSDDTKKVLANVIMAAMVLGGTVFAAMGGLSYITTSLYGALASSSAFQDSTHCLTVIGYSKNYIASSLSGGVKACSVIFDENRAAVDFITTKVQFIWAASLAAVGGFSYAAWGNIRNMIIRYLIDPVDQTIDYLNPQKPKTQEVINKFLDGLITTSAAASWANEEARMANQPGTQNNWVIQANKDQGQRPKLYFNFTKNQLDGGAITIANLKDVTISMAPREAPAPQANFPGPPAVDSVRGVPAPPVELKLPEQQKFYGIIRSLEEDKQSKAAAPALPVVGVGQASAVALAPAAPGQSAAAAAASQGPGQGGKKRRRTMKKKKHHRKNKTGKKKHHKKKHHKKHKKSHKKHHKKHGRKTRKH